MSRGKFYISENIKHYREKLGLSQEQFSRLTGVAYNVIIKIESGATTNPTIDTVAKIAEGLKIRIDNLVRPISTPQKTKLICKKCKKEYDSSKKLLQCSCGGFLDLVFTPMFPLDLFEKRKTTMWRYREAIPIEEDDNIISFDEIITPLISLKINKCDVLIKQDQLFPSGAYEDRGASVLLSKVKELGIQSIFENSAGNVGSAIAAYSAHGDINCDIYVSSDIPDEKLVQIQSFGAKIHKVKDVSENIKTEALKSIRDDYYINHVRNPFFLHGIKTFAFEICEQLGWKSPDVVIVPVGNGTLILGAYLGFSELKKANIIKKIPKLIGIQSVHCAPLYITYKKNLSVIPKIQKRYTIAEEIAIEDPVRGEEVIETVKQTKGTFVTVTDKEITDSLKEICRMGYYIEPTSAATIAGVKKYTEGAGKDEIIVSIFTGSGLKTTEKIMKLL